MGIHDSGFGKVRDFNVFLKKALDTTNIWNVNTGGGTTPAINLQANCVVRITSDGTDGDKDYMIDQVVYRGNANGPLIVEWRMKTVTSIADGETFVGATDATTDETPIQVSTTDVQSD